ncbi:MAG: cupredoxin domain-containing protein [Candidatus Nanoarchaeia archaeon]|nr:cupredoxin domain-containing protein [Candidatus Nanoarchaeia archaeon]
MEIKHILVLLVVIMLSGCAAKTLEQPGNGQEIIPPVDEVQQTTEQETQINKIEFSEDASDEKIPSEAEIFILRAGFDPEKITVKQGSIVSFLNADNRAHLISVLGKESSPNLEEGDVFGYKFEKAGTYAIMDIIFGFGGTVIVEE